MFKTRWICWYLALVAGAVSAGSVRAQGNGVPIDSYPRWQERVVQVVQNAARMAPQDFRDAHLQYPGILQPGMFPPVAPIVWCEELNHAARFHSEDIADCGVFGHVSCDGTSMYTRVSSFYPWGPPVGENAAYLYINDEPFQIVVMWLEDGGVADGDPLDGHRDNVMNPVFTEGGGGWAAGQYEGWTRLYYTYDYGGRDLGAPPKLVDGVHWFPGPGETHFWANWYAPGEGAPQAARVWIDGESHELSLHLGTHQAGTWVLEEYGEADCRSYVFQFLDANGATHWYPATGSLRTWGEGGCGEDYLAGATPVADELPGRAAFESIAPNPFNPSTTIRFRLDAPGDVRLTILDVRGRLVRTVRVERLAVGPHTSTWDGRDDTGERVGSGMYFARLSDGSGQVRVAKLTLVE